MSTVGLGDHDVLMWVHLTVTNVLVWCRGGWGMGEKEAYGTVFHSILL